MSQLADNNNGFRYLVPVIDIFKVCLGRELKRKDSGSTTDTFEHIFAERKPMKLQTDSGKGFVNSVLQKILCKHGVQFFTSQNKDTQDNKGSIAKNFN